MSCDAKLIQFIDSILFIDQDDGTEYFDKEKSHENESMTTSVSDNTFYDTDGASNFQTKRLSRQSHNSNLDRIVGRNIVEPDTHNLISDWASTAEDTSFYDDRSSALKSVIDLEYRSIASSKSIRGAYSKTKNKQKTQKKK